MQAAFAGTADRLPVLSSTTCWQRRLAAAASILIGLLLLAAVRHWLQPQPAAAGLGNPWLRLHLASVAAALPLGVILVLRRKGGRTHRMLGRAWAMLMLAAAASGLGLGAGWSPIHLLSLLTLVAVPCSVRAAIRGDIASHRRGVTLLFASLVVAGFFTLLPTRMLGGWLFGPG